MKEDIQKIMSESSSLILSSKNLSEKIEQTVNAIVECIKKGNKIVVEKHLFKNKGRSYIQKTAVTKSLELILRTLK